MRVSLVIPAFNNAALTERCVTAVFATTTPDLLAEVVVVDDASSDGTSAAWTAARPGIVPVLLAQNRGFSGACNAGAARCTGDAILFLNNDAFAQPGSIAELAGVLSRDSTIGVVGARLLYADGSIQHAGMGLLPGDGSAWWHVYKHQSGELADAAVARDVLAVTGAALLIRRDLFTRLGGFDEGYANGWEDIDLCLRAWCAGFRARYAGAAVFEHLESATLGRGIDHTPNARRFAKRWGRVLAAAPRYPLPPVPPLAVGARRIAPAADARALAFALHSWGRSLGSAVTRTRAGSRFDRFRVDARAALDRRLPTLEVSWADASLARATGPLRVAFVAPSSPARARNYVLARHVDAWWTPTAAGRDALVDAGADPARVTVAPLGAVAVTPPVRDGPALIGVTANDPGLAQDIARACPSARVVPLRAEFPADFEALDLIVAVAVPAADPWGTLLPTALSHGCSVLVTPDTNVGAAARGVTIAGADELVSAAAAAAARIAEVRARAPDIIQDARRRFDAALAAEHVAELARGLTGGLAPAALIEVDASLAARLRGAAPAAIAQP